MVKILWKLVNGETNNRHREINKNVDFVDSHRTKIVENYDFLFLPEARNNVNRFR